MARVIKIKFEEEDESSLGFILADIADKIEQGYESGMGSPVDWHIADEYNQCKEDL